MFLKRFALAGAILLFGLSVAFCWEVEQGSRGNELLLEIENSSDQSILDVSVRVKESPHWTHFETRELPVAQVLRPEETRTVKLLFDVSEEAVPETEGRVELLVEGGQRSWTKEVLLAVLTGSFLPELTALHQSSPNPSHQSATIRYELSEHTQVSLRIYDLTGRLLKILVDEQKSPGRYEVEWSGDDETGNILPNGTYFYCLKARDFTCTKKLVLVR